MTEEEAKTKWCPFARLLGVHHDLRAVTSINRMKDGIPQETYCIGSACMAWRLGRDSNDNPSSKRGFCGLAGKS